jgi:hypothetical protein
MEVYDFLNNIEKSFVSLDEPGKAGIQRQIIEMKDLLNRERNEYEVCPLILFCFICLSLSVFSDFCVICFLPFFFCLAGFASTSYGGEWSFHEINF